jgi:biopolymer transport protein TolR
MGAGVQAAGGGRPSKFSKKRGKFSRQPVSDINVTPLVDVMLVLLIVFMVAAPMLTTGVAVKLPKTDAKPLESDPEEPLTISVKADGSVYLQSSQIDLESLIPQLQAILQTRKEGNDRIYVKADKTVGYGEVMVVMGKLNAAGFTKIGLITEPKE